MTSLPACPPDRTAQAVIDILRTGRLHGGYDAVSAVPGPRGGLAYGRAGARLADSTLRRLIEDYASRADAAHGAAFGPFLPMLKDRNKALDTDRYFHNLLRATADDPAMRAAQDAAVDAAWTASAGIAAKQGLETALGRALVHESRLTGGWETLRRRTAKEHGPVRTLGEAA